MRTVLVRIQTPQPPLFRGASLPALVADGGKACLGPAAPAAVHRDHVAVAHFLQIVCRKRGAEAAAAIKNDGGVLIGEGLLDIAFDDAFAEVNGAGEVAASPFAVFAGVYQNDLFAGVEAFFRFAE